MVDESESGWRIERLHDGAPGGNVLIYARKRFHAGIGLRHATLWELRGSCYLSRGLWLGWGDLLHACYLRHEADVHTRPE